MSEVTVAIGSVVFVRTHYAYNVLCHPRRNDGTNQSLKQGSNSAPGKPAKGGVEGRQKPCRYQFRKWPRGNDALQGKRWSRVAHFLLPRRPTLFCFPSRTTNHADMN